MLQSSLVLVVLVSTGDECALSQRILIHKCNDYNRKTVDVFMSVLNVMIKEARNFINNTTLLKSHDSLGNTNKISKKQRVFFHERFLN